MILFKTYKFHLLESSFFLLALKMKMFIFTIFLVPLIFLRLFILYLQIVEYDTNINSTKCACNHLTDFGGGGPFAKIEPLNLSNLLKHINLAANPTVFAVVMALFGVYFIMLIWCWKNDKYDIEKVRKFLN